MKAFSLRTNQRDLVIRQHTLRARRRNLARYWQSIDLSLVALAEEDGPIGDEYCWEHSPGGWTCWECRESKGRA